MEKRTVFCHCYFFRFLLIWSNGTHFTFEKFLADKKRFAKLEGLLSVFRHNEKEKNHVFKKFSGFLCFNLGATFLENQCAICLQNLNVGILVLLIDHFALEYSVFLRSTKVLLKDDYDLDHLQVHGFDCRKLSMLLQAFP